MSFEIGKTLGTNEPFYLDIPSIVTGRTFIASITRFGKSWTARKIVEECFGHAGIIIVDPEGEYISLREKYPFLIIGKDIPLQLETAEFMADKILDANISVIIDLSLTEVELGKEYVNKLLSRFFFLETTMRKPYLIIVEEAEEFCPERGIATTTCLEILRNITKKGGKRGIGIVVIAHRPAWISKGVLSQCVNKVIGRIDWPSDLNVLEEFARIPKAAIEKLPTLDKGEFCFTGDWVKELSFVKVGPVKTVHLGFTPEVIPPSPKELKIVIESLQRALPEVIEKIKPTVVSTAEIESKIRSELEAKYKSKIEAILKTADEKAERKYKVRIEQLQEQLDKLSRAQALQPVSPIADPLEHPIVCVEPNTEIVCQNHIKKIKDIKVGDLVLTHNGQFRPVTKLFQRKYQGLMFRIKAFHVQNPLCITPEHPILVKRGKKRGRTDEPAEWVSAGELKKGDWVALSVLAGENDVEKIRISETIMGDVQTYQISDANYELALNLRKERGWGYRRIGKQLGINIKRVAGWIYDDKKPLTMQTNISVEGDAVRGRGVLSKRLPDEVIVSPDFMRLCGYYLAEGCTHHPNKSKRVDAVYFTFNIKEQEFIEDVRYLLYKIFGVQSKSIVPISSKNSLQIFVYSAILAKFFGALFGHSATSKRIPYWMLRLPLEKQKELVKGWWRGDGSLPRKAFQISTSSKTLANQMTLILHRLGIIPTVSVTPCEELKKYARKVSGRTVLATADSWQFKISGESLEVMQRVVDVNHPWSLQRRKCRGYAYCADNVIYVRVKEIEKIDYDGIVFNLAVREAETYTANGIIVHNCARMLELPDKARDLLIKIEREPGLTREQLAAFLTTSKDTVASLVDKINRVFHATVIMGEGKPIRYKSMLKRLFITDVAKREIEEIERLQTINKELEGKLSSLAQQVTELQGWKQKAQELDKEVLNLTKELEKSQLLNKTLREEGQKLKEEFENFKKIAKGAEAFNLAINIALEERLNTLKQEILKERVQIPPGTPIDEKKIESLVEQKIKEKLPVTPLPTGPIPTSVELEHKVTHFDFKKPEEHVKADTTTLQGRIIYLITKGFFDTRHNRKEVVTELSNRGWIHSDKEVDDALLELCQYGIMYRKISTGNVFWYSLTPEAKQLIHEMEP